MSHLHVSELTIELEASKSIRLYLPLKDWKINDAIFFYFIDFLCIEKFIFNEINKMVAMLSTLVWIVFFVIINKEIPMG